MVLVQADRQEKKEELSSHSQGRAIHHVPEESDCDHEIGLAAVLHGCYGVASFDESNSNYEMVMAAVSKHGCALQIASKKLERNYEIVMAAVSKNGLALEYASEKLKSNHEIVLAAVSENPEALQHASEELKSNHEIVMAAVLQNGMALQFCVPRAQGQPRDGHGSSSQAPHGREACI